ncbi:hypothetical protein D3C83_140520 [compost metagenome]
MDLGFAQEAVDAVAVLLEPGGQQFENFAATGDLVLDLVNHGRACSVQDAQKPVPADGLSNSKSHMNALPRLKD